MWVAEDRQEVNSLLLHDVSPNKAKISQGQEDCNAEWDYSEEGSPSPILHSLRRRMPAIGIVS